MHCALSVLWALGTLLVFLFSLSLTVGDAKAGVILENRGPYATDIPFYAKGSGVDVLFYEDRIAFIFLDHLPDAVDQDIQPRSAYAPAQNRNSLWPRPERSADTSHIQYQCIEVVFPERAIALDGVGELDTRYHLFKGQDRSRWYKNIRGFRAVVYHGLQDGQDVCFFLKEKTLYFDSSEISDLRVLEILGRGEILERSEGKEGIVISATGSSGQIFTIAPYSEYKHAMADCEELDPACSSITNARDELEFSTFFGGSFQDYGMAVTLSEGDEPVILGRTTSWNLPVTYGAYDITLNGTVDIFVAKFTADGRNLIWCTYLGGQYDDRPYDMAIDKQGNIFITGFTNSDDFPTTPGAYDPVHNWGPMFFEDVFLAKLSQTGSELLASTYLGGEDWEYCYSIFLDEDDSPIICGDENSYDFPITESNGFLVGAFVAKLDRDLSVLMWSVLLGGGNAQDVCNATENSLFVVGTAAASFLITPGAYDETYNGHGDGFVARLSSNSGTVEWSTYLGGTNTDLSGAVCQSEGAPIVVSWIASNDFPTNPFAYDTSFNGGHDMAVTRLSPDGSSIEWSTYLGGSSEEGATAARPRITLDSTKHPIIAWCSLSHDYPTTHNAFDTTHNGCFDIVVSCFDKSGSRLLWSTFFGSGASESCRGLDITHEDELIITGPTDTYNCPGVFPVTADAYDTSYNGNGDAFLTKLGFALVATQTPNLFAERRGDAVVVVWELLDGGKVECLEVFREIGNDDRQLVSSICSPEEEYGEITDYPNFFGPLNYWIRVSWIEGSHSWFGPLLVREVSLQSPRITSCQPNPFNPMTAVSFTVDRARPVRIAVYDMVGQRVTVLVDEPFGHGRHEVAWSGTDSQGRAVASGTYIVRLKAEGVVDTRKIVLVR